MELENEHQKKTFILVPVLLILGVVFTSCIKNEDRTIDNHFSLNTINQSECSAEEGPEIVFFVISPEQGQRGDWFQFSWETRGAEQVTIQPSITDIALPLTGMVAGQPLYSRWYTLIAEKDGQIARNKAWAEVHFPGGSSWRLPRADASNSAYSPYPGPTTNSIRWIQPIADSNAIKTDLIIDNDGSLFSSNPAAFYPDGLPKFPKRDSLRYRAIGPDGTLYCFDKRKLLALHPDGSLKWSLFSNSHDLQGFDAELSIDHNGTIVMFYHICISNDCLHGYYIISSNGEILYHWGSEAFIWYSVALNCDQSILHSGTSIACINYQGELLWYFHFGMGGYVIGSLITDPMCHIYGQFFNSFYPDLKGIIALDGMGNELWHLTGLKMCMSSRLARAEDGTLYVVLEDEDSEDGLALAAVHYLGWLIWQAPLKGECENSEPVVDVSGHIYVTTKTHVTAINYDGTELWMYHDPDEAFKGAALSMDGTLYTIGHKGLYAFGAGP